MDLFCHGGSLWLSFVILLIYGTYDINLFTSMRTCRSLQIDLQFLKHSTKYGIQLSWINCHWWLQFPFISVSPNVLQSSGLVSFFIPSPHEFYSFSTWMTFFPSPLIFFTVMLMNIKNSNLVSLMLMWLTTACKTALFKILLNNFPRWHQVEKTTFSPCLFDCQKVTLLFLTLQILLRP